MSCYECLMNVCGSDAAFLFGIEGNRSKRLVVTVQRWFYPNRAVLFHGAEIHRRVSVETLFLGFLASTPASKIIESRVH